MSAGDDAIKTYLWPLVGPLVNGTDVLQLANLNPLRSVTILNSSTASIGVYASGNPTAGVADFTVQPNQVQTLPLPGNSKVGLRFSSSAATGSAYVHISADLLTSSSSSTSAPTATGAATAPFVIDGKIGLIPTGDVIPFTDPAGRSCLQAIFGSPSTIVNADPRSFYLEYASLSGLPEYVGWWWLASRSGVGPIDPSTLELAWRYGDGEIFPSNPVNLGPLNWVDGGGASHLLSVALILVNVDAGSGDVFFKSLGIFASGFVQ